MQEDIRPFISDEEFEYITGFDIVDAMAMFDVYVLYQNYTYEDGLLKSDSDIVNRVKSNTYLHHDMKFVSYKIYRMKNDFEFNGTGFFIPIEEIKEIGKFDILPFIYEWDSFKSV